MDLSPESITSHEFDLNRRGYDPDEVDARLREIAAAAASREAEVAELRRTINELEAKVQDASESEEALRLTLKAAAHAKEELLAGAREQAAALEQEATERAQRLIADAEARAESLTQEAQVRSDAMTRGASERASEVAKAALSESELLVVRIEQLRAQVEAAEGSLRELSSEAEPRLGEARRVLDEALEAARASAENPELLAAAATPVPAPVGEVSPAPQAPPMQSPEPHYGAVDETAPESYSAPDIVATTPPAQHSPAVAESSERSASGEPVSSAAPPEDQTEEPQAPPQSAPQLEVVHAGADDDAGEPAESSADISNKVDRLLEELREVT